MGLWLRPILSRYGTATISCLMYHSALLDIHVMYMHNIYIHVHACTCCISTCTLYMYIHMYLVSAYKQVVGVCGMELDTECLNWNGTGTQRPAKPVIFFRWPCKILCHLTVSSTVLHTNITLPSGTSPRSLSEPWGCGLVSTATQIINIPSLQGNNYHTETGRTIYTVEPLNNGHIVMDQVFSLFWR